MYFDKKLSGVDCVQTLSRLNRTTPGKTDTFILDFVNSPDDIKAAFAPYYGEAELLEASDPNDIYDLQSKLLKAGVFDRGEVYLYAEAFFDKKSTQALLSARLPAVEGHKTAENLLKHLRETRNLLEVFKKNVNSYSRFYEFISQVLRGNFPDAVSTAVMDSFDNHSRWRPASSLTRENRGQAPLLPHSPVADVCGGIQDQTGEPENRSCTGRKNSQKGLASAALVIIP